MPDDRMLRRVPPAWIVPDPKATNGRRASSEAFRDDNDGSPMSVYSEPLVISASLSLVAVLHDKPGGWAVAALEVSAFVAEEQRVVLDPIEPPGLPHPCGHAHCVVIGEKPRQRRGRLAAQAQFVAWS